jgi:hypothetical protein
MELSELWIISIADYQTPSPALPLSKGKGDCQGESFAFARSREGVARTSSHKTR